MTKNEIDPDACTIISIMVLHYGIVYKNKDKYIYFSLPFKSAVSNSFYLHLNRLSSI